jgi:hypothetical protein
MAGEPSTANALMRAALSYAERCWPVFPLHSVSDGRCTCSKANCSSPGKHPRTEHGFREASTEAALITRWWATWPDANVGIAMGGPARLAALDIDGPAGEASLQELVRQHGELPATLESRTGKGRHLLFTVPEGANIRPSVGALARLLHRGPAEPAHQRALLSMGERLSDRLPAGVVSPIPQHVTTADTFWHCRSGRNPRRPPQRHTHNLRGQAAAGRINGIGDACGSSRRQ